MEEPQKCWTAVLFGALLVFYPAIKWVNASEDAPSPPKKSIKQKAANPKLQTVLQLIEEDNKRDGASARAMAQDKGITMVGDSVEVVIEPVGGVSSKIGMQQLKSFGAEIKGVSRSLVRARVPRDNLIDVTQEVSGIDFIRLPHEPRPLKVDTSEGVNKSEAKNYHEAGFTGEGVKVAIIDLGFYQLSEAMNSGDLPPELVAFKKDYTGSSNLESFTNHGTDVAEIVHDMAPDAKLYLMRIGDGVGLEEAKNDAIAKGVDVINHSVGWFNTAFYDGTGLVSRIAADAYDNGILWVNAAGNSAESHWQGNFEDSDDDQWHEFSAGDQCHGLGRISWGNTVSVFVTWDAWPESEHDYDLYLKNSQGKVVATSDNHQTGSQPPTERLFHYVTTTDKYCFSILKRDKSGAPPNLEAFVLLGNGQPTMEYPVEKSSITDPANDEKVLTVGAIGGNSWSDGQLEEFSSLGPTNDSRHSSPTKKPDLIGPDSVSTSNYGTFSGTSAAAPHVAGAAALILSGNMARTPAEVQSILESSAVDLGTTGKDNYYGSGKLAMSDVSQPPDLIQDFSASDGREQNSTLAWTNPSGSNLEEVTVRRTRGNFPENNGEGELVYKNTEPVLDRTVSVTDTDLKNGNEYYYSVFTKNSEGNCKTAVKKGSNADSVKPLRLTKLEVMEPGWNMVSIPVTPASGDLEEIFSDEDLVNSIYRWEPGKEEGEGKFLTAKTGLESVGAMEGFWMRFEAGQVPNSYSIKGNYQNSQEIVLETPGWHQVGVPLNYGWSDIGVTRGSDGEILSVLEQSSGPSAPHWVSRFAWAYDPGTNKYIAHEAGNNGFIMEKGRAYWVRTYKPDVRLVVPYEASPPDGQEGFSREYSGIAMNTERANELNIPTPPPPPKASAREGGIIRTTSYFLANEVRVEFKSSGFKLKSFDIKVFNSSGELIHESENITNGNYTWDPEDEITNGCKLHFSSTQFLPKIIAKNTHPVDTCQSLIDSTSFSSPVLSFM